MMLKSVIKDVGLSLGYSIKRATDADRLRDFIACLHPVVTEKGLVRLGGDSDGGYLVPDDLDGIAACFSPGVDVVASFEEAVIAKGIPCFLADASVEDAPIKGPLVHFEKMFLGVVEDETTIALNQWIERCAPKKGDLLLQMDIEGAEWPILLNVSDENLDRLRIIVIEFHQLDYIVHEEFFSIVSSALSRLLAKFHVVHIHPNNYASPVMFKGISLPKYLEMTFLRKNRAEFITFASEFPHPLDRKNVPWRADFVLPSEWYNAGGQTVVH